MSNIVKESCNHSLASLEKKTDLRQNGHHRKVENNHENGHHRKVENNHET